MDPDKFLSAKVDSRLNSICSLRCSLGLSRMDCIVSKGNIFLRNLSTFSVFFVSPSRFYHKKVCDEA